VSVVCLASLFCALCLPTLVTHGLGEADVRGQSACAHSKDWRCRAQVTPRPVGITSLAFRAPVLFAHAVATVARNRTSATPTARQLGCRRTTSDTLLFECHWFMHLRAARWEKLVDKVGADRVFGTLEGAVEGKVSGMAVRPVLEESGLPVEMLSQYVLQIRVCCMCYTAHCGFEVLSACCALTA
jgi:hypothetical protein